MATTPVMRHEKVAFMKVGSTFRRMTNFTELTTSKGPKEYSRQYVDEAFERSSIVGYAPSISYSFDWNKDSEVHGKIVDITNNECTGSDAVVSIAMVDIVKGQSTGTAYVREWSVIPDSEGGSLEAYTYSGSFKAEGARSVGTATTTDGWATVTIETIVEDEF